MATHLVWCCRNARQEVDLGGVAVRRTYGGHHKMSVPVEVGGRVGPEVNKFEQVSSEQTFIHTITMGTPLNFDRVNNGHGLKR